MRKLIASLAAASMLSSCALAGGIASITPSAGTAAAVQAVGDKVVVTGTRALILANLAYQAIAEPLAVALERGLITGARKQQVKDLSARIVKVLNEGKAAQDEAVKARKAAEALGLVQSVSELSGVPMPKF